MSKPTMIRISGPFDPRHVGGVSVPGATIPLRGIEQVAVPLEPDEPPSHTFVATGNVEVPRRSNSITNSLSRPSLRLKTSLSLLRGRSRSDSSSQPSAHQNKKEGKSSMESTYTSPYQRTPVESLTKKTSSSRLWQSIHRGESLVTTKPEARTFHAEKSNRPLPRMPSHRELASLAETNRYEYGVQQLPEIIPDPPPKSAKAVPVRPKRADSGTAINLDDIPPSERPLGFQQIMAVPSLSDRMVLYKKARDYWATADHGLVEWADQSRCPKHLPHAV